MPTKIILSSDESIICPKDQHRFPIHQGITRQTMEKYEKEFEKKGEEIREEIEKDARRKALKEFTEKKKELEEKLTEKDEELGKVKSQITKIQKDARDKALAEYNIEKEGLLEDLSQKEKALKEFREREQELRKEKQKLQSDKDNFELDVSRRIDEERKKLQEEISKKEAEKLKYKFAELEKKLEDASRLNEDLTRKLEQGSQQLQGEVLELELETVLRTSFPYDRIEPVRKGARGADVIQRVHSPTGQACGTIIWEAKRAETWSEKWVQKLKDNQLEAGAEIAVIVSTSMPKDSKEPFLMKDDIWVVSDLAVRPVAETLRAMLLESAKLRLANTGKGEKMELLYNYLNSPQFAQRIRAVVETFGAMKKSLDQERNAMARLWKQRDVQIERVASNMTGMCGELQAISHGSLHQLDSIEQFSLPSGDDVEEEK